MNACVGPHAELCKVRLLRNSDIDGSRSSHRFLKLVAINSRKTSAYTPNLAKNKTPLINDPVPCFPINPLICELWALMTLFMGAKTAEMGSYCLAVHIPHKFT